jgi:hypothetical protein
VRAEPFGRIDFPARAFQVDLNFEAMLAAAQTIILGWAEVDFIDSGTEIDVSDLSDGIVPFSDHDFRLAVQGAVETNARSLL